MSSIIIDIILFFEKIILLKYKFCAKYVGYNLKVLQYHIFNY